MKVKLLIMILAAAATVGCTSSHKLTMPKGKWQPVNQSGFIPAKAQRYYIDESSEAVKTEQASEQNIHNN